MEKAPASQFNTSSAEQRPESIVSPEQIELAKELMTELQSYKTGEAIVGPEALAEVEGRARELSVILAALSEPIRLTHGFPGGVIYAPLGEAENDAEYQVAA